MQKINITAIAIFLTLLVVGLICYDLFFMREEADNPTVSTAEEALETQAQPEVSILEVDPTGYSPIKVPLFEMTDEDGQPITKADLKGHYSLIYFGFSYCPDVCLNVMDGLTRAYEQLTPEEQEEVTLFFISFDRYRDTPERLAEHLSAFNDDFKGISPVEHGLELSKLLNTFAAQGDRVNKGDGSFTFDHSSHSYLLDKEARFLRQYNYNISFFEPEIIANDLKKLIARDKTQAAPQSDESSVNQASKSE